MKTSAEAVQDALIHFATREATGSQMSPATQQSLVASVVCSCCGIAVQTQGYGAGDYTGTLQRVVDPGEDHLQGT